MKILGTLVLLLVTCIAQVRADDYLANSDFSKGSDGWSGDGSDAVSVGDPFSSGVPLSGLTLRLNSDRAIRIYQLFRTSDEANTFTLVCTPSPGCRFTGPAAVAKVASDLDPEIQSRTVTNTTTGLSQTFINYNYSAYMSTFSNVAVLIVNRDKNEVYPYPLRIDTASPHQQTVTLGMNFLPHQEYELYVAFPPGEGTITLNKVSLIKGQATLPTYAPPPPPIPKDADNILAKLKWAGDVGDGDDDNGDMGDMGNTSSGSSGNTVIQLHHGTLACIHTTFRAPAPSLRFTINCTPSDHCEYSGSGELTTVGDVVKKYEDENPEDSPFDSATASEPSAASQQAAKFPLFGDITLILIDRKTSEISFFGLGIVGTKAGAQTGTILVPVVPNHDYALLLAFPEGSGSMTLNHAYLSDANAENSYAPYPRPNFPAPR